MSQIEFDDTVVARLEKVYGSRDVQRRRRLIREALGVQPGERVLDVGCGPGFYVAELLDEVGPEGSVVGVDGSAASIAAAAKRCAGRDNASFLEADAAALPVDDGEFDAALSVQTLEYLPDPTAALAEIHRALRPGGRVVIWDVDWATVAWRSAEPERMQRMLAAWDSHLTHVSLPQTLTGRLRAAGFDDVVMEGHSFATNEFTPETYGGYMAAFVARFALDAELIDPDEAGAWLAEQEELGAAGDYYFACIQFCFSARRPG